MRFGFAECFLIFAGIVSFTDLNAALILAGVSAFFAFGRYAMEVHEKQQKREEVESTAKLLNEQAEELGQALGKLFSTFKTDVDEKQKKYDKTNLH
tara:strand:- start:310 stop:597 length:288 start_codon:yes stop_codon:yes gene_type:complete